MASNAINGDAENGLTNDEISRLNTAFECPEFRQLLVDYVNDVNDPKNREKYEEEVIKVEKERGYDVTFVHPEPCYVLKSQFLDDKCVEKTPKKVFINIASNENIENTLCEPSKYGENGLSLSIPHSFSPQRQDLDKKGLLCIVYDCIFHPHTLSLALSDPQIKTMVENIALNGIETNFKVLFDRSNVKHSKKTFKGPKIPTLIRKKVSQNDEKPLLPIIPDHNIKYRHHFDIQDYAYSPNTNKMMDNERPHELVVEIKLPLIESSEEVRLDVQPNGLFLKSINSSKHCYDFDLKLPCAVREDEGTAKFDLEQKTLTVLLPTYKDNESLVTENSVEFNTKQLENEVSKLCIAKNETKSNENRSILLLPKFSCHQDDQEIVFVLKTENVASETMKVEHLHDGMACQFRYLSKSCFQDEVPIVYSLFLRFPCPCKVEEAGTSVSINEDSVVVIFKKCLTARHNWMSYFYEIDGQQELKEAKIEVSSLQESLNALWNDSKKASEMVTNPLPVSIVEVNADRLVIDVKFNEERQTKDEEKKVVVTQNTDNEMAIVAEEQNGKTGNIKLSKRQRQKLNKLRSISESSDGGCEDLGQSPSNRPKGILKHLRRKTLSESSDDVNYSSSVEYTTVDSDIPEEEGLTGEIRSTVKKSVHFNSVVMKNVFRLNSIIARQRERAKGKKHQRNLRKKHLMAQRQNSESDCSEGETMTNNIVEGTRQNLNNVNNDLDNLNGNVSNPNNVIQETKQWPKNDNSEQYQGWKVNYNRRKIKKTKKNVVSCDNNNKPSSLSDN